MTIQHGRKQVILLKGENLRLWVFLMTAISQKALLQAQKMGSFSSCYCLDIQFLFPLNQSLKA